MTDQHILSASITAGAEMRALRIFPQSGLCSRLRVIIGAMAQAEAENRELEVFWGWRPGSESSHKIPVAFEELWQAPFSLTDHPPDQPDYAECHIEPFRKWIGHGDFARHFHRLQPTPKLAAVIAAATAALPDAPVCGVQIRAVLRQRDVVELAWFQRRMRQLRQRWPDLPFFLALDVREVSDAIHREFGPAVTEQAKPYRYNQDEAFAHAADLYLLILHCDYVVGTNCSASSQLVALVRGATYHGPSHRPGGVSGGRYEDAWNPVDEALLNKALGC